MSEGLGSESPELASSTTDFEVVNDLVQLDREPRRRRKFESVVEDQESAGRRYERTDTEWNLGIEPLGSAQW